MINPQLIRLMYLTLKANFQIVLHLCKNIFACLFSIHNTISLSRHAQVCLSGLHFEVSLET